jgi:hypothetical protein
MSFVQPIAPELAGVCRYADAIRPGFGVEEAVRRLRRYEYVERRLYDLGAQRLTATPEWEAKCALALHLYQDGEHAAAIRSRIAEMRTPPLRLDRCPDPRLEALMDEALKAEDTPELLAGVFGVLRPALLEGYRRYSSETHPLIDFPTTRALRLSILEEEEAIRWGEKALDALTQDDPEAKRRAGAWRDHLARFLQAAGGIDGEEPVREGFAPPTPKAKPFAPDFLPRRDSRFRDSLNFNYRPSIVARDGSRPMDERILALMYKRLHEMDVPEMMAALIAQTPGKPWDYYRDMGRQLWDEARHAMMGEIWFVSRGIDWTQTPNHVGWSLLLNRERAPLERHAILFYNEHSLMAKTGKRAEWELSSKSGDALAAFFQDFDWADEVLHKQIGLRWLKTEFKDARTILAFGEEAIAKPHPLLDADIARNPQYDWWPDFVRRALGAYREGDGRKVETMKGGLTSVLNRPPDSPGSAASRELIESSG